MRRIFLFILTNLAVLVVASLTLNLLGVAPYLNSQGLNLQSLLIFCAVFGFAGSFISLALCKFLAKLTTKTRIIDVNQCTNQEHKLLQMVHDLALSADIKIPEVGIFPSPESNAFATGWNKNAALVAVSQGLLDRFHENEIKAVLGHEIGHVANGDMVTLALIQGIVNTFVMFFARIAAYGVDIFLRRGNQQGGVGIGYYLTTMVFEIVFGIAASMVVMWFSRLREFRADEAGAKLSGTQNMIAALRKLQSEYGQPSIMPEAMTAFGIRKSKSRGIGALFSSHPPLEERIAKLEQMHF